MKQDTKRQSGKNAHENYALTDALILLNSANKSNYQIIEKPEPPDAVIYDGQNYSWLEHVDAFRDNGWRKHGLVQIYPYFGQYINPSDVLPITEKNA